MRSRLDRSLTDSITVLDYVETGENAAGETTYSSTPEPIEADVPALFDPSSTSFIRESSGEEVRRPASVTLSGTDADLLEEGRLVDVDGVSTRFEVRSIDPTRDHRRGTIASIEAELREVDS